MSELSFIYVFFLFAFLSLAVVVIIQMRDKKSVLVEEDDFITKFLNNKQKQLEVNLPSLKLRTYLILSAISPVVSGTILWLVFPNKALAIIIAAFTVLLPEVIVQLVIDKRKKKYEENYVRALKAFSSALRAGMSVQQGVREVINNPFIDPKTKEGFRQIDSDITIGIGIDEAFRNFAEHADNRDAWDVSAAISMQTEVGGSEAKVIDSIANNIDERLSLRKEIRSIFAGTDFMIRAFDLFPFVALIAMNLMMPDLMNQILEDPIYLAGLALLLIFTVYGSFSIRKKANKAKGE